MCVNAKSFFRCFPPEDNSSTPARSTALRSTKKEEQEQWHWNIFMLRGICTGFSHFGSIM